MVKQKWFQLSQRANIVSHWIIEVSKTKPFIFLLGIVLGVIAISVYDGYQRELFLAKNQRIVDSLNVELSVKERENYLLLQRAEILDGKIEEQKKEVTTIVNNFPSQKRPEISNKDSAVKFIIDFIRK